MPTARSALQLECCGDTGRPPPSRRGGAGFRHVWPGHSPCRIGGSAGLCLRQGGGAWMVTTPGPCGPVVVATRVWFPQCCESSANTRSWLCWRVFRRGGWSRSRRSPAAAAAGGRGSPHVRQRGPSASSLSHMRGMRILVGRYHLWLMLSGMAAMRQLLWRPTREGNYRTRPE